MSDYKYIENLLVQLLSSLVGVFSESEANEVQEFIDAGEYGLALDTLVDVIDEESKPITLKVVELAKKTALAMELDERAVEERLMGFVNESKTEKGDGVE